MATKKWTNDIPGVSVLNPLQKKFVEYLNINRYHVNGYKWYKSKIDFLIEKDGCEITYSVFHTDKSFKNIIATFTDYWNTCSRGHQKRDKILDGLR